MTTGLLAADVGVPTPARDACPRTSAPRAHDASASLWVGALLSARLTKVGMLCRRDVPSGCVTARCTACLCNPLPFSPAPPSSGRHILSWYALLPTAITGSAASSPSAPHCGIGFPQALCHLELPLLQLSSGASRSSVGPVGRGLCGRIGGLSSSKLSYATCSEGVSMLQHGAASM